MGRFAKVHPDARREAIVRAVLDDHWTQADTIRAAAAGELPGCEAFTIPPSTVCNYVAEERRKRQPKLPELVEDGKASVMVDSVQARLTRILERDLTRVERDASKAAVDPRRLERLASAADRIAQMGKYVSKAKGNGKHQENGDGDERQDSPLLTELQAAASTSTGKGRDSASGTRASSRSTTGVEQQHEPTSHAA